MSYKSPIDIVMGEIQTEIENRTLKAVQECGIHVDKDEMIKALKYDRVQYEKGYTDGYFAGKNSVLRCKDCMYWQYNNVGYPHEKCRWGKGETPDADDFCSCGVRKGKE